MLLYLWVSIMTMAVFPGGERMMQAHASAFQARLLASIETPPAMLRPRPGLAIGAANAFTR
jgi:hypothetical protein